MTERILVVEDNAMNLQLTEFLLRAAGFAVESVGTAADALERVRSAPPDLILMDIDLPGMDGLAATRQLKADPDTSGIPVVALTANAMRGDRERCLEAGCSGYVSKPIDTRSFATTVRAFLPPRS